MGMKKPKKSSAKKVAVRTNMRYGWHPDVPDHRDHLYAAPLHQLPPLPPSVDLRPQCPPVYDQGQLGSCTGNAIAGAFAFAKFKETANAKTFISPSRLFIYFNERVVEHTVASDSGAQIRDGIKTVVDKGVCSETTWPYNVAKFRTRPPKAAYKEALTEQAISYQRVAQALTQMKGCLAEGYPFVMGFTVYESFESAEVAQSGVLNMPASGEQSLGGHAVCCVGYDDSQQRFIIRNSWGPGWGQSGYFTMPYAYLIDPNLADDLWTIRTVE